MIQKHMKILTSLLFIPQILPAQNLITKEIPGLDSVLRSVAGLDANALKRNAVVDSLVVDIKKDVEKKGNILTTTKNFFSLFEKNQETQDALMHVFVEYMIGKKATMTVIGKQKNSPWKIKAILSYFEDGSIVDSYVYLCMDERKMGFCSDID